MLTYTANTLAIGATKKRFGRKPLSIRASIGKLFPSISFSRSNIDIKEMRKASNYDPLLPTPLDMKRRSMEKLWRRTIAFSLVLGVGFLLILLQSVISAGAPGISSNFLTNYPSSRSHLAGIGPVIIGSVWLITLTMLFALPAGVGAAVYLTEMSRPGKINIFLRRTIQNLAAVPSIIFGLVGLFVFSRILGFGLSLLTGSLTLAMMVLPMIVVTTEEALLSVPKVLSLIHI